jgi:hypothetical protein
MNKPFIFAAAVVLAGALTVAAAQAASGDAAGTAGCGAAPIPSKPKMLLVINFDVEDYVTPASEGIDDIPKWLAQIMTEEGVTGTFYVICEKARSLEKRGRRDVIEAMARHDIGSHTNFGSIHPTVTEALEKADWAGGLRTMLERESAGFRELERIFGVPVTTMGRHGGSYGPQLVAALGALRKGFSGSPVGLPGRTAAWFCNALNFSVQVGGYDDVFYRDDLFEPAFAKLQTELPEWARTYEAVSFFVGHPTKIRAEQFWDFNYYAGRNPSPAEWKAPLLRPAASMPTAQKNFRRMMRWLKSRDDIEITTFRDWMGKFAAPKDTITASALRGIAGEALRAKRIPPGADFSPAEAFAGLAASIVEFGLSGRLPGELKAARPLGPAEMPRAGAVGGPAERTAGTEKAGRDVVFELARLAEDHIRRTEMLPSDLEAGGIRIGTGPLFALFCAAYLDLDAGGPKPAYDLAAFEAYPQTNEKAIVDTILGYKSWPVHRPDLDMARIVELTRLQLWTLKPAFRKN